MRSYKILALDESGKASYNHSSELFVLSGVILPEKFKDILDRKMRKLKRKYFNNEDIVFHSRDMLRKKGPFSALRDKKKEISFWSEFISILNSPQISMLFVIVDKKKARKCGWQPETILKRAYMRILGDFSNNHLLGRNCGGKIVSESDPSQDFYLIHAHNHIQGVGTGGKRGISPKEYREKITSLSLVKKLNQDIDVQIADTLAIIAGVKYGYKKNKNKIDKVTQMKLRLIERKLRDKSNPSVFSMLV